MNVLAEAVGQITSTAKKEDYETFSANIETTAKVVCLLTESAAQVKYSWCIVCNETSPCC